MLASISKLLQEIFQLDIWITDLLGSLRMFSVRHINEEKLSKGFGFDGSSIPGFAEVNDSDFLAIPDLKTLRAYPWEVLGKKICFVIADVYRGYSKERLPWDPRFIAQKAEMTLSKRGLTAFISPEMEFFLFNKNLETGITISGNGVVFRPVERKSDSIPYGIGPRDGYFQYPPLDQLYEYRVRLMETLDKLNLYAIKSHHEVASGQIEINIRENTPVFTADSIQVFKFAAKNIAKEFGLNAVFMPKPVVDDDGSGMHIHLSLWRNNENLFYDPNDDYAELSQLARYFIGGILEHAGGLSAILAPTINSYKRLVPGFEAPVYVCWGRKNRSALIRVPLYHARGEKINAKSKRIEIRFPDPSANPYLAIAAIIFAGMDGVDRKIDPGDPIDLDVYHLRRHQLLELGIKSLPGSLKDALEMLEADDILVKNLGRDFVERYIELKMKEIIEYSSRITHWEYQRYFIM